MKRLKTSYAGDTEMLCGRGDLPSDLPQMSVTPVANKISLYLTGEITDASDYVDWLRAIKDASPRDEIEVYINSPGGDLDTSIQLFHALSATEAQVTAYLEGACCSGASVVALSADNIHLAPGAYFMVHSWTGGVLGKFHNVVENTDFQKEWFPKVMKGVYEDFLTPEELEQVLSGKDLWYGNESLVAKFEYLYENRKKRTEEVEAKQSLINSKLEALAKELIAEANEEPEEKPAKKKPTKKTTKKPTKKTPAKKKSIYGW